MCYLCCFLVVFIRTCTQLVSVVLANACMYIILYRKTFCMHTRYTIISCQIVHVFTFSFLKFMCMHAFVLLLLLLLSLIFMIACFIHNMSVYRVMLGEHLYTILCVGFHQDY